MERLTQINGNNEVYCIVDNKKIVVENIDMLKICQRLKLYEDLEEQGLLVQLPVPIGTTVYKFEPSVIETKEYIKTTITRYEVFDDSIWFTFANGLGRNIKDFGKTVFFTKEEAEQKLKEMNTDNGIAE